MADAGADPKLIHGKASMAKLFCSEAANRCADRALQIFGGRGYMRTTAAERFWRELRVDRIWEGTSEIQRLIVRAPSSAAACEPCSREVLQMVDLSRLLLRVRRGVVRQSARAPTRTRRCSISHAPSSQAP